jgi:lipopolysaccharide/colanic/teichoic acid biosynthesis glycosyltransferase
MVPNASRIQSRLKNLNEADGPVFKIRNDPRFTRFGKILSRTGLDELPQMINVMKGEMSIVGPRPLPTDEANQLTAIQKVRELVKPGITSSWVIAGSHKLSFKEWMDLDRIYVEKASLTGDFSIILKTIFLVGCFISRFGTVD